MAHTPMERGLGVASDRLNEGAKCKLGLRAEYPIQVEKCSSALKILGVTV